MRFFTMSWWCGEQNDGDGDPVAEYAAHLLSIRDLLPSDLLAIEEAVSLHDARLRTLCLITAESSLLLELNSHTHDERFTLHYSGVERFESTADPKVGLGGPFGYGDFGYSEVEVLPGGAFQHCLLFSSGIELGVVFSGFRLQRAGLA